MTEGGKQLGRGSALSDGLHRYLKIPKKVSRSAAMFVSAPNPKKDAGGLCFVESRGGEGGRSAATGGSSLLRASSGGPEAAGSSKLNRESGNWGQEKHGPHGI